MSKPVQRRALPRKAYSRGKHRPHDRTERFLEEAAHFADSRTALAPLSFVIRLAQAAYPRPATKPPRDALGELSRTINSNLLRGAAVPISLKDGRKFAD